MRLVVDLQALQTPSKYRGIGRYARSLTRALLRNRGEHDIWIAVRHQAAVDLAEIRSYFSELLPADRFFITPVFGEINFGNSANTWKRKISEQIATYSISLLRPDFVLSTSTIEGLDDDFVSVSFRNLTHENCAIAYDLIPFHEPARYLTSDIARQWYLEKLSQLVNCNLIFAISEYAKQDFLKNLPLSEDIIHNILCASEYELDDSDDDSDEDRFLNNIGLHGEYFLFVGSLETRKNPEILIRAFALLPNICKSKMRIVFAGAVNLDDKERVTRFSRDLGVSEKTQLVFTGFLSDHHLKILYKNCTMFIFPSYDEGFGLPVLEAMACGAPVLSSDRTSLPEVVGRSDLLFDPDDAVSLRDRIVSVLEQPAYRDEIVKYGLSRSHVFSWDRSARQLIAVLERRLSQRTSRHQLIASSTAYFSYVRTVSAISMILDQYDVDGAGRSATAALLQSNINAAAGRITPSPFSRPSWRIEGPFDSTHSLAVVNRETARALSRLGADTSVFSTEGPGDFEPSPEFLGRTPDIARMHRRGRDATSKFTIVSRLLYPPKVTGMNGALNLVHHYAWEESGFPQQWMDDFNTGLNGLTCMSRHVQKVMIDYGIRLPTAVTGIGVSHVDGICAAPHFRVEAKKYRFLHISSCFPRKGIDCLLAAYGKAFRRQDDVSLVIKTFSSPHNTVFQGLTRLRAEDVNYPDVVIIEADLSDAEIVALYNQCHVLVAPSRAEGFGLPAAEAMLHSLPVIATRWSGNLDFCNDETAWLVDYRFARAQSHFDVSASVWAEPCVDHLAVVMKRVRSATPGEIERRTSAAIHTLRMSFSWDHVAWRLQQYVADLLSFYDKKPAKMIVAWVSTWNTRCGISTYSQYLLEDRHENICIFAPVTDDQIMSDGRNVTRNWVRSGGNLKQLLLDIEHNACNVVVLQFSYVFFVFQDLKDLLERLLDQGRLVVFETHATHESDPDESKRLRLIAPLLVRCARVLVHSISDMNRLNDMGVVDNVTLFPHPYPSHKLDMIPQCRDRRRFGEQRVIASYGFFLPNKGLMELIEAFASLSSDGFDGHLLLVNAACPDAVSHELIDNAQKMVVRLGLQDRVTMIIEFLPDEESVANLREADLIVLPYQPRANDSASGAVRICLASGVPVAVTPLPIFDDLDDAVLRLPGCNVADLATGIATFTAEIEAGSSRISDVVGYATRLVSALSYEKLSRRFFDMLYSLHLHRQFQVHRDQSGGPDISFPPERLQFRAQNGLMKTEIGRIDDNGNIQSTGREGILTFGPCISLRSGVYRLRALGTDNGHGTGKAHLRVTSNLGQRILHEVTLSGQSNPPDGYLLDTEFAIDGFEEAIEFTLSVDAYLQVTFRAYLLDQVQRKAHEVSV